MKKIFYPFAIMALLAVAIVGLSHADLNSFNEIFSLLTIAAGPLAITHRPLIESTDVERLRESGVYTGEGDISLEFNGGAAQSFIDEIKNTMEFSLRIINSSAFTKRILLFPGYFNTKGNSTSTVNIGGIDYTFITGTHNHNVTDVNERGIAVDAMIDEGDIATNVKCESLSKGSVQDFISYVLRNPTRIPEIIIGSNNTAQYGRKLILKRINPAKDWGEDYITLQRYFETSQYRDEKITVNTSTHNLQLDDQTLLVLEVEAKVGETPTVVDLTLKLGASLNIASWLYQKANIAASSIRNILIGR